MKNNPINKSISIIIPAYNEEGNIEKMINFCEYFFLSLSFEKFEIIVVNDGSADRTGDIINNLSFSIDNLKVFHHLKNQGMGSAVGTGISHAQNDLIFITCADFQFDIREIEKFLPYINNYDIIIGYRLNRDYNFYRKFITFVYHFLIKLLFDLNVKDPSWVKIIRREVFKEITIISKGFFWDTEILVRAIKKDYLIKEVGVHSYKRAAGRSSAENPFKAIESFLELIKFWWRLKFEK